MTPAILINLRVEISSTDRFSSPEALEQNKHRSYISHPDRISPAGARQVCLRVPAGAIVGARIAFEYTRRIYQFKRKVYQSV